MLKDHPPELLLDRGHRQLQPADDLQRLLVAVGARLVEIKMRHAAQRLHVQLASAIQPVEPFAS